MKGRAALIALALFSAQASAGWDLVAESDVGKFYIDFSTIRNQGVYTYAWTMTDYTLVQTSSSGKKYKSDKSLAVHKCDEMQKGYKTLIFYSDSLGTGNVVFSEQTEIRDTIFRDVVPETLGFALLNAVCGGSR